MLERMTLIAPAHVDSPFDFHFMNAPRQPQHLAQLESLDAGYDSPVLTGVDLLISSGDRLGLLGVNGAGKSTLVKALADGSTVLAGTRTVSRDTRIGYFAQHQLDLLDPDQSPFDHVRMLAAEARESELRRYLGSFGFSGERIYEPVAPFSGGEKARLVLALIIRQQPNLLLLDEPTNHLDLEMRQALSRALVEFGGAIVLISHDRHLLRTVCDELIVVHDGTVERFDRTLDEYPAWLAEQQAGHQGKPAQSPQPEGAALSAQPANRKLQRQLEAQRRLALQPLANTVRDIEDRLARCRSDLGVLEDRLADPLLYADPSRTPEMTGLVRDQAALRARIGTLEEEWLEASEALEQARTEAAQTPG
jgi:ATP-binding cassette subfamily F protein 3